MISIKIKFGSDDAVDTYTQYGFIYLSSDNRFAAPLKDMESTSYPEQDGVNYYSKVVKNAFEYKVSFLVMGATSSDVNAKIATFNADMFGQGSSGSDKLPLKTVELQNTYKKAKIVGYPVPIAEATDFWRDARGQEADAAKVEFTIKVANPAACNFDYSGSAVSGGVL